MTERQDRISPTVRWLVWGVYAALWTGGLVMPMPDVQPWRVEELNLDLKFAASKTFHVAMYAGFAILTGWLRAPFRHRLLLLFLLMAHGTLTELIQLHVSNRTGTLEDVAFDHAGIALGLLFSWRWWCEPS